MTRFFATVRSTSLIPGGRTISLTATRRCISSSVAA
jgi:hypothetical protein